MISKNQSGFLILELVLYLSLFSFIVISSVLTFYQLSEANQKLDSEILIVDEAEFILKKINWLTKSFEKVEEPVRNKNSKKLHLIKNGLNFFVYETNGIIYLKQGNQEWSLNSRQTKIENLLFENLDLTENRNFFGIKTSFEINGNEFKIIRFSHDL